MQPVITIGKRDFIQHTNEYIKQAEKQGNTIIITHHNEPVLKLTAIKKLSLKDLQGIVKYVSDDINEPILPGCDEW